MKLLWIGAFIVFIYALPLKADMIQGDGYAYFLSAPLGWVLDKTIASDIEADCVLYPQGMTYQTAPSVITVSAAFKGDGFKDLNDLLRQDEEAGIHQNNKFSVKIGPTLRTHLQKILSLRFYEGFRDGGCEAVAYLEETDLVMVFMLASSNDQIMREDLPALQEVVESYDSISNTKDDLD